jgi:hypothetical protein
MSWIVKQIRIYPSSTNENSYVALVLMTAFWWRDVREREHLGDPGVDGRIILRWIFRKWDVGAWTGSCWLRIGTGGGHLWVW